MNYKQLKLNTLLLLGLGLTGLQAQESLNATGGDASGGGGSASYSVGQILNATKTGTSGSVAQGVQQAYEISVISGIRKAKGISLAIEAYPNPTTEFLTLDVKDIELSNLDFQLFDMQGKLLHSQKITSNQTRIVMNDLQPAVYFLRVFQGNKEVKVFQIILK